MWTKTTSSHLSCMHIDSPCLKNESKPRLLAIKGRLYLPPWAVFFCPVQQQSGVRELAVSPGLKPGPLHIHQGIRLHAALLLRARRAVAPSPHPDWSTEAILEIVRSRELASFSFLREFYSFFKNNKWFPRRERTWTFTKMFCIIKRWLSKTCIHITQV